MKMAPVYWAAYQGLVLKQLRRFLRSWALSLLPTLVSTALFMLIFGHFMGRDLPMRDGLRYADYLMPGLVMFAVITNAYNNCSLAFFGAKLQRHIEEMLVAPMPAWLILSGFVTAGVLRGLLAGLLVAALALPFTTLPLPHPLAALGVALISALLFATAGVINGMFARSFDDSSLIATFVLTPLTYLGGVFYPIGALPAPWATLSAANPMVYVIDGFRYGLLGTAPTNLPLTIVLLPLITVAVVALAWHLIARGVGIKS